MTYGAILWLIVFGLCAGLFFGIALVVSFRGVRDLRDLLTPARDARKPR